MTVADLRKAFSNELNSCYPTDEINSFYALLSAHWLGYNKVDIVLNASEEVPAERVSQFSNAIKRLRQFEPIQYIIGETEFFGLPIKVTPAVLIPRPETEELVAWMLSEFSSEEKYNIMDIGTGSGCIAIALAKHLSSSEVTAIDVSTEALEVATKNAAWNDVSITFEEYDILKEITLNRRFHCIVSNPPYVRAQEKKEMAPNVLDHEPELALFVSDENPLLFYKAIAAFAYRHLLDGGSLFLEINEYLSEEMVLMLKESGFAKIEVKNDFRGKPRMIKAIVNAET